ncbi:hypothetical protein ACH4FE_36100 [Streptomyces celluloflavus]|uniref:hypothetical protein n=1 Tax=Streptomyces celluloflavus TaxID=58344 RepID=UPI00379B0B51
MNGSGSRPDPDSPLPPYGPGGPAPYGTDGNLPAENRTTGDHPAEIRPVEDRLRRAFAARAESIGIRDLRPAEPPGPYPRRARRPGSLVRLRRFGLRRIGLPLAAAATVTAAAAGYLALGPGGPPPRPVPASSPSPVGPSPSPPAPTGPALRHAPGEPSTVPGPSGRTADSQHPGTVHVSPPQHPPRSTPTPHPTDPSGHRITPPATPHPPGTATPDPAQRPNGGSGNSP